MIRYIKRTLRNWRIKRSLRKSMKEVRLVRDGKMPKGSARDLIDRIRKGDDK